MVVPLVTDALKTHRMTHGVSPDLSACVHTDPSRYSTWLAPAMLGLVQCRSKALAGTMQLPAVIRQRMVLAPAARRDCSNDL